MLRLGGAIIPAIDLGHAFKMVSKTGPTSRTIVWTNQLGVLTTTMGWYAGCDDDEDDNDVLVPTGTNDALDDDEGTIAGTVLTEFIAIDADTLAALPYDTEVAEATVVVPTGGGIVTKKDSAYTPKYQLTVLAQSHLLNLQVPASGQTQQQSVLQYFVLMELPGTELLLH